MATITSAQSGNFSAGATWVGGVVPGAGDDAVAATGTVVTIDTDVTVISFQQAGTGKFVLGGGRTVSGNVIANAGTFTSGGTVEVTAGVGTTATITGNVTGVSTTTANTAGIVVTGVGTFVLNGSVTGSAGNGASEALGSAGVYTNVTCTITINGAVTGGTGTHKRGFQSDVSSNGTFTINGNVTAGGTGGCHGVFIQGTSASLAIIGNVLGVGIANSIAHGVTVTGTSATVTITGNVNGSTTANSTSGVAMLGISSVLAITGNLVGGSGSGSHAVIVTGASVSATVTGNVTAVSIVAAAHGIATAGLSSTITVTGNVTAGLAPSNHGINATGGSSTVNVVGSVSAATTLSHGILSSATANGVIFQGNLTDSLNGAVAIYTRIFRMSATNSGITTYTNTVGYPTGTPVSRVSPDNVTGMAQEADVRLNTIYGFNSELEGTLAVPPATAVGSGVPVDNTIGTAVFTTADIAALVGAQVAAAVSTPSVP